MEVYLKQQRFIYNSHYINIIDPQEEIFFHHNDSKFTEHLTVLIFLVTRLEKLFKGFTQKLNVGIRKETCYIHSTILRQSWPIKLQRSPKIIIPFAWKKEPEIRPNDCCLEINVFFLEFKKSICINRKHVSKS